MFLLCQYSIIISMEAVLFSSPNSHIPLLEKCSNLEQVNQIHAQMIKTRLIHHNIPTSKLLTALCKISLNHSLFLFHNIEAPNTYMYNTIIKAFSNSQHNQEQSIFIYCQMLHSATPHNLHTFPSLIKSCHNLKETQQIHTHVIKFGFTSSIHTANSLLHSYTNFCSDTARKFFKQMEEKNAVSWTSIINGYVASCNYKEALVLFREMQERNIEPDKVTLTCALSACAGVGALDQGQWIHTYIKKKRIRLDSILACVLVDMYSKCGELDEAIKIFEETKYKRCVFVWTSMITGFAVHGRGMEAVKLFMEMEAMGIKANEITFTAVLTACSYSGFVDKGKTLFNRMVKYNRVRPSIEHYGCMVDLFGRAGLLKEAEDLILEMPMKPNGIILSALLNACRVHKDYERGTRVGKMLVKLEPSHCGRHVNLANMYAANGEWDKAAQVRQMMKENEVTKLPGSSMISFDGTTHEFFCWR